MKKLVIFLLLFAGAAAFAQNLNVNIDADYYIGKTNTFLVKKDGGYTSHYLWVEFDKQQHKYITKFSDSEIKTLDFILKQHRITEKDLIPVKSLRRSKMADVMAVLEKLEFTYPVEGDSRKSYYHTVNFADGYAVQRLYIRDAMQPDATDPQISFFEMVPVTVNYEITFFYFFFNKYIHGYVVPLKDDKHFLRMISNNTTPTQGNIKNSLTRIIQQFSPEGELFTQNGKYGMRRNDGGKTFIPAVYDSIKTHYGNLMTAYDGTTPKLFHRNGDAVAIPGLRAVHVDPRRRMSGLVGNSIHFIDNDGKLAENLKPADMWGCGTVPHITESIANKNGNYVFHYLYQYGDKREMEYILASAAKFKSLTFLNGSLQKSYRNYGMPEYKIPQKCFIAETNEGKTIVQIDYTQVNPVEKVMLPFGDYTFIFRDFNYPVKFTQDSLSGFFPQNKTARYVEVTDFDKGFARFKMTDGKMGWLSFEGNEYFDE
ncbi:MAG: hypothetical protein ACO1N9_04525 [Flavobacterium sp.]